MATEPRNDHIPGRWFGDLSLRPFLEVKSFIENADDWTKERRADAKTSVFKAHPGIRSVMLTDMASLEFMFHSPSTVLDRLDGPPGFGGLAFNHELMLEGVIPALVAHNANHDAARGIIDEMLTLRRHAFAPACSKVYHYGLPMLVDATRTEAVDFKVALHHAAVGICFDWMLGIVPGPSGEDTQTFLKGCFGLRTDGVFSDLIARGASRAKNGPYPKILEYSKEMLAQIRGSDLYPMFVEAAYRVNLPEQELAGHLMFAASFNGTAGAWATLFPAIAQLYVDDELRRSLSAELCSFDGDLFALNRLPLFHDFFLESMRLYGRPRHYYRRALVDVEIPVSDGPSVHVDAGTTLCLVATVARQDRAVWGDDAAVFDVGRYARNPSLRTRVYPFGPPTTATNRFGCAAAEGGYSSIFWKSIAAPLARSMSWRLTPWPEPDVDSFDGVSPSELSWIAN